MDRLTLWSKNLCSVHVSKVQNDLANNSGLAGARRLLDDNKSLQQYGINLSGFCKSLSLLNVQGLELLKPSIRICKRVRQLSHIVVVCTGSAARWPVLVIRTVRASWLDLPGTLGNVECISLAAATFSVCKWSLRDAGKFDEIRHDSVDRERVRTPSCWVTATSLSAMYNWWSSWLSWAALLMETKAEPALPWIKTSLITEHNCAFDVCVANWMKQSRVCDDKELATSSENVQPPYRSHEFCQSVEDPWWEWSCLRDFEALRLLLVLPNYLVKNGFVKITYFPRPDQILIRSKQYCRW